MKANDFQLFGVLRFQNSRFSFRRAHKLANRDKQNSITDIVFNDPDIMGAVCEEKVIVINQASEIFSLCTYSRPERVNGNFGSPASQTAPGQEIGTDISVMEPGSLEHTGKRRRVSYNVPPTLNYRMLLSLVLPVLAESPSHHCQSPPLRAILCS